METTKQVWYAALIGMYALIGLLFAMLSKFSAASVICFVVHVVAGFTALALVDWQGRNDSDRIDSAHVTAANALIGLGMIESAFAVMNAASTSSQGILAVAPVALTATATGIAAGLFFFIRGHIVSKTAEHAPHLRVHVAQPGGEPSVVSLDALNATLSAQSQQLERLSASLEKFSAVVTSEKGAAASLFRIASALDDKTVDAIRAMADSLRQINSGRSEIEQAVRELKNLTSGFTAMAKDLSLAQKTLERSITSAQEIMEKAASAATERANKGAAPLHAIAEAITTSGRLTKQLELMIDSLIKRISESSADVTHALDEERKELATWRAGATEAWTAVGDLQKCLGELKEATDKLYDAMTKDQRGVLDSYLQRLHASAQQLAGRVMEQVPSRLTDTLRDIEEQLLATIRRAANHASEEAAQHAERMRDAITTTAERFRTLVAEFETFNRNLDRFKVSVKTGSDAARQSSDDFNGAADQLSDAVRRFLAAATTHGDPASIPLLAALSAAVDNIARAAEELNNAQNRLTTRWVAMEHIWVGEADLRARGAQLRIRKANAAS